MENFTDWLQVSSLLIILTVVSVIFVRGITLLVRGKHSAVRFGLELILFFSVLYIAIEPVLEIVKLSSFATILSRLSAFFWWISLAFTINAVLSRFVWSSLLTTNGVRRIPKLLTDGVGLLIYATAIMIVLHYVYGEPVTIILASSGAIAFVLGLAAQPTVQEIFAGLSLNTTKALRMGDFVEIDGIYGQVYEINWRSISLKSPNTGSLYIFPNSAVSAKTILNFDEPNHLFKYWVTFKVEYSASPDLVINTIAKELEQSKFVCRDPKPDFNILGLTEYGTEIRLRFYFEGDDPWWPAQNEACMAIWSSLRRKGIRLASKRMMLASGDEFDLNPWVNDDAAAPNDNCMDQLSQHPALQYLPAESLSQLAQSSRRLDYTPPDCVYLAKTNNNYFYYILEGALTAYQTLENGEEASIAKFGEGDIVGLDTHYSKYGLEHKLQADSYSVLYQLDAQMLKSFITDDDKTATALSILMQSQRETYNSNIESHHDEARKSAHVAHQAELNLHLREHVDEIFDKPLLHKVIHLVRPRKREQDLLRAMMSACALITASRGEVDNVEEDYLRKTLGSVELFRHIEIDECLALYESNVGKILADKDVGTNEMMQELTKISGEHKLCQITMGIAYGMAAANSIILPDEQVQLEKVAKALGMPTRIDQLVTLVQQK